MNELLKLAKRPAVSISPSASAREAGALMMAEGVGALAVLDSNRLVGIVSERDIVARVVVPGRDADEMRVGDIMTTAVRTVTENAATISLALEIMNEGKFRHLPIVSESGELLGMLSVRHLLRERVGELDRQNADLVNFIAADGPGG